MLAKSKIFTMSVVLAAVLLVGWFLLPQAPNSGQAGEISPVRQVGSGSLDGLTFASEIGPVGKPGDVNDILVFENGMFVSTECERLCNYPASAYFVRETGDATEFISESLCSYKDATIVWRGQIKDGKIEGVATWTTKRWYWTIEKELAFVGTIVDEKLPVLSAN